MSKWTHKLTTARGSYYLIDIDGSFWSKNNKGIDRVWCLSYITQDERELFDSNRELLDFAHNREDNRLPGLGEYLYISGRDSWWLSTEITKIELLKD